MTEWLSNNWITVAIWAAIGFLMVASKFFYPRIKAYVEKTENKTDDELYSLLEKATKKLISLLRRKV